MSPQNETERRPVERPEPQQGGVCLAGADHHDWQRGYSRLLHFGFTPVTQVENSCFLYFWLHCCVGATGRLAASSRFMEE